MREVIKNFDQLTTRELYELLRLRSQVFIAEQGGRYQDLDRIDYESLHLFYEEEDGAVVGYLRLFEKQDEPGTVQLGRIVTRDRGTGLGRRMMERAEELARSRMDARSLYLTGRKSALGFYLKCGFYEDAPEQLAGTVPYYCLRRDL